METDLDVDDQELAKPKTAKDLISDFKEDSGESESEDEISVEPDLNDGEEPPSKRSKRKGASDTSDSKKKKYIKQYVKSWEKVPAFKPWLSESILGNVYFYCKFCKTDNRCGRTELEKHMASRKHMKNAKGPTMKVQVGTHL